MRPGSAAATNFSAYFRVGVALGLQTMGGSTYTIKPELKAGQKGGAWAPGLANVTEHFTHSFPEPNSAKGELGVFYLVPSANPAPTHVLVPDACGRAPLPRAQWEKDANGVMNKRIADELYKRATKNVSASNPAPNLTFNDVVAVANTITREEALSHVRYIFSPTKKESGGTVRDTETIVRNFKNAYHYNPEGSKEDSPAMTTRKLCNYGATMLCIAKLMPWDTYVQDRNDVINMLVNAISGKPYQPVVITAELTMQMQHNGGPYTTIRTVAENIAIQTGYAEANVRAGISAQAAAEGPNPAVQILRAAKRSGGRGTLNYGGSMMIGWHPGRDIQYAPAGVFCRTMLSVSDNAIGEARKVNSKIPGTAKGVWGYGVFGIDDGLYHKTPPPTTTSEANLTPGGTVSVSVEPVTQIKPVGGYTADLDVTVKVDLSNTGYEGYVKENDNITEEKRGSDIASTLRWLAYMEQKGFKPPNPPEIGVAVVGSKEGVKAVSAEAAETLIETTRGYWGTGVEANETFSHGKVSPNDLEKSLGMDLKWDSVLDKGGVVFKDPGIKGVKVTHDKWGFKITITDLMAAAEYLETSSGVLTFNISVPGKGILETEESIMQHWFKVGSEVVMYGPKSLTNMDEVQKVVKGLTCDPKFAYATVRSKPEKHPYYYSTYLQPYSELKQGTVPASGGGSAERFNSMTGTPTFTGSEASTDPARRHDFAGSAYVNNGHYYQYFASGGSEFVVQFDGEYVEAAKAARTYKATFSSVPCNKNDGKKHNHNVGDDFTWEQPVNGFSYVKIKDLKVWKLSEARLDGTRELLETDEVTATVHANAPSLSYNIADSDDAAHGRLIYSWETAQKDTVKIPGYPKKSNNDHFTHRRANQATLDGDTQGITCEATCVSDYIVLRTSNGDQSVLYYEYKSKAPAAINTGNCIAEPIEFDKVPYETIWTNNSKTSEGTKLPEEGITYGGYNGNYSSVSTKYKSSGHASNIDFNSTSVYQNRDAMSGSWDSVTEKPTQKFRLMNDKLVIPDTKQNGEYIVGESEVFYENIVNFGNAQPNFPIITQSEFGGKKGFTLRTTYSPSHDKINDIVVYNPVSNQNAIVVSLPKERDQRIATHHVPQVDKSASCPGDASCPFQKLECSVTQHVHTEACYQKLEYEVCVPELSKPGETSQPEGTEQPGETNQPEDKVIRRGVQCRFGEEEVFTFTAPASGTVRFYSTVHYSNTIGRVYLNGVVKAYSINRSGHFDTGAVRFSSGDTVKLDVYDRDGGSSSFIAVIDIRFDKAPTPAPTPPENTEKCYVLNKARLSCSDPHHAHSYNWKLYTYGLRHKSGHICDGRSCTDTSDLIFPTQEVYTLDQCAKGKIVKHANGEVHLTTTDGICSYCGRAYKEVLSDAQSTDREPDPSEYGHYTYGDPRCWKPCNNPANHRKYISRITGNGKEYEMGDFINLDWPFHIYFPNTGDFYGTGAEWSSNTSSERGKGYKDGMNTTEWIRSKWVEFPFAVVYNNQTFLANERIYLEVPKTDFEFYVPLHDSEMANAEVKFGTVAINAQNGETLECGKNESQNITNITYQGKPMAHHHNADKRTYIDVVGRIGNLALNDTGDFRFSNLFKKPLSAWLVQNIVRKVDPTKQNHIMLDPVDVRRVPIASTGVAGNTHNTRPERGDLTKALQFPLTPEKNNIAALRKQPVRIGYDSYIDLTTLGNYYGNSIKDEDGNVISQNMVFVKPHYYRMDLTTGDYKPVDVYMDVNGKKVLINDNDSNTVSYTGSAANVNLNWVEEMARRNYSGEEVTNSKAVAADNDWVQLPKGSSWVYGNYNLLNLTQRNRTFVGSEYTYQDTKEWDAHKDPSNRLHNTLAAMQGQRWHFNVGLPSSAVFVYSGQEPSKENIDACSSGNAVIFCALEIYAQGEVWTLAYDGSNVNAPFAVTPGGKIYDPVVPYPTPDKNPKGEEMPIVAIISINHSSKEDADVAGTQ